MEEILKSNNINYAFTKGRLKSIDSISNNFNANGSYGKKDKKLEKISDIKDLIGCRVVFYLKEDLERFIEILRGEFSIVEEQNKETIDKYDNSVIF